MVKYLRAFCQRVEGMETGTGPIRFVASTEEVARDGKALRVADWRLENYRRNPVVLWVHDYMGRNLPIGRAVDVRAEGQQLVADVEFDQADEFARAVESKYRRGYLNAVSVGWTDVAAGKGVAFHDLMDISAVPVPADPRALMAEERRAVAALGAELQALVSERVITKTEEGVETTPLQGGVGSEVSVWDGVASAMLALYRNADAMEDETRHGLYIALERAYRKLERTPPEWITAEELAGLGPADVDGLFLEGEARVGAVLSARNRSDLEQAITLIHGVIERASKEKPEKDESEAAPAEEGGEAACDGKKKRAEDDALLRQLHSLFAR